MSEERNENPLAEPPSSDMPARVRVVPFREGTRDAEATLQLLLIYGDNEGFHCPCCGNLFTDPDEAVEHLAESINRAMLDLARPTNLPGSTANEKRKETR